MPMPEPHSPAAVFARCRLRVRCRDVWPCSKYHCPFDPPSAGPVRFDGLATHTAAQRRDEERFSISSCGPSIEPYEDAVAYRREERSAQNALPALCVSAMATFPSFSPAPPCVSKRIVDESVLKNSISHPAALPRRCLPSLRA